MQFFIIHFAVFLGLCVSSPAFAENKGEAYVARTMPILHKAVVETLGAERSRSFFKNWTSHEVRFLSDKLAVFFHKLADPATPRTEREKLAIAYRNRLIGALGESYGLAELRSEFYSQKLVKIVDEVEYHIQNGQRETQNNRPDGILYETKGGKLFINHVLESKLGTTSFDQRQVEGWLERWRQVGLVIENKLFRPENIFLKIAGKNQPLMHASSESAKHVLVLVSSSDISSHGERRLVFPLNRSERLAIAGRLMTFSNPAALGGIMKQLTRYEREVQRLVKQRLDEGKYPFPSDDVRLQHLISSNFRGSGQKGVFDSLPKRYRKLALQQGFRPDDPISSALQASGVKKYNQEKIITIVKERLDAGLYPLPSHNRKSNANSDLVSAVSNYIKGGMPQIYRMLPKSYQRLARNFGFDPQNPIGSAQREYGAARHTRASIIAAVKDRIEMGQYPFPKNKDASDDPILAKQIVQYFGAGQVDRPDDYKGAHAEVFKSLPGKYQKLAEQCGYDPVRPEASGRGQHDQRSIIEAVKLRLNAGLPMIPKKSEGAGHTQLLTAIYNHFKGQGAKGVYDALPPAYRRKAEKLGYKPAVKGERATLTRYQEEVLEKVSERIDRRMYPFPKQTDPADDLRLARRINWSFKGGAAVVFSHLSERHKQLALEMGFNPKNPRASAIRKNSFGKHTRASIVSAVEERLDAGKYPFPAQKDESDDRPLAAAISRYFAGGQRKVFENLSKDYQQKARSQGFDPEFANLSGKKITQPEIFDKARIVAAVIERLDSGKYPFPHSSDATDDRSLAAAIQRHFLKNRVEVFAALPAEYQRLAIERGFSPLSARSSGLTHWHPTKKLKGNDCARALKKIGS
jgi:hypothetical protein